ncbi:hypothetical protein RHGRI_030070 [Rhododendron griersonianum]|uniref:Uncharacterized protein n=1 Tax=Rhododendron griersonianum TaxID=479676 RepID=A0AAV6ISI0_9ERIC|nr:hypothetical protein RHGRI_030070 [Rhododendron griersonianum]
MSASPPPATTSTSRESPKSRSNHDELSPPKVFPLPSPSYLISSSGDIEEEEQVSDLAEDSQEKYEKVMGRLRELKGELLESSVVCESNMVSDTPNDSFSIEDVVLPSKESTTILDPKSVRRKGRPPSKRKQGGVEKNCKKKRETLSNQKAKEVQENAVGNVFGTQESVVNSIPSYMGQFMCPNMMPQNLQPNMAQPGTILPFSPTLCPTGTGGTGFGDSRGEVEVVAGGGAADVVGDGDGTRRWW